MELEEMQKIWSDLSGALEKQKVLTHKIIMEMTERKYRGKFMGFLKYEGFGAVICLVAAALLLVNFYRLDTWYFMAMGIAALLFLTGLPWVVLRSVNRIKSIDILNRSHREVLADFARAKQHLLKMQRTGIYLSFVFAAISLPLAGKLINNRDIFREMSSFWYLPVMFIFLLVCSRWVYRKYQKATSAAEELLREIH
jgi:cbb3-type cytochrome oxidase subunit 3